MELQAQKSQDEASKALLKANGSDLELPLFHLNSKKIKETKEEPQYLTPIDLEPNVVETKYDIPQNVEELPEGELAVLPENDVVVSTEPNKATVCIEIIIEGTNDGTRDLHQGPSEPSTEKLFTSQYQKLERGGKSAMNTVHAKDR